MGRSFFILQCLLGVSSEDKNPAACPLAVLIVDDGVLNKCSFTGANCGGEIIGGSCSSENCFRDVIS